jgi:AcrR family transcriptional regulator
LKPSGAARTDGRATRGDADDAILGAAAALFRANGIPGTPLRAIAEAAGVLLGSLTYRYPSKDDLVIALMRRAVRGVSTELNGAIAASSDPLERLRLALRAHLRVLLRGDDAVFVLLFDWARLPDRTRRQIAAQRRRYDAVWDRLVLAADGAGLLRSDVDLALVRKFVFGAANSVAAWYRPDGPLTPDQIADVYSALIGRGTLAANARGNASVSTRRITSTRGRSAVKPQSRRLRRDRPE